MTLARAYPCTGSGCCESCTLRRDQFTGASLNPIWDLLDPDPSLRPTIAGGKAVFDDKSNQSIGQSYEPFTLFPDLRGVSVQFDIRFTLAPPYSGPHTFWALLLNVATGEYVRVKVDISTAGLVTIYVDYETTPTPVFIDSVDLTSVNLGGVSDIGPNEELTIKLCVFQHRPGDEWYVKVRANRKVSFGSTTTDAVCIGKIPTASFTGGRSQLWAFESPFDPGPYEGTWEVDNWVLSKITDDPLCECTGDLSCEWFLDTFARADSGIIGGHLEEVSGDWSIVSNQLDPPATGVVRYRGNSPDVLLGVKWQIDCNFGGAAGTFRLRIDQKDSTHYHYGEFTCIDFDSATLQLFRVNGGSPEALTGVTPIVTFGWSDWHVFAVCISDVQLTATVNQLTNDGFATSETTPFEGHSVLIETNGVGTNARIDNAELTMVAGEESQSRCEGCVGHVPCDICEDGLAPKSLIATIQGVTQGSYTQPPFDPHTCFDVQSPTVRHIWYCPGCAHVNGTWVLESGGFGPGPVSCTGFVPGFDSLLPACHWSTGFGPTPPPGFNCDNWEDVEEDEHFVCKLTTVIDETPSNCVSCFTFISVSLCHNPLNNKWVVVGEISAVNGGDPSCGGHTYSMYYRATLPDGADPINCPEVLDGLKLSYVNSCSGCDPDDNGIDELLCNGSGSSITLRVP